MTVLRDLVTRLSFKADTSVLKTVDQSLMGMAGSIKALAGTAISGWAVKTGTHLEVMTKQLGVLAQDGLDPITKKIEELSGKGSIFSIEELTRSAVALQKMGFSSRETAELLEEGSLAALRADGNFEQVTQRLGQAIMGGGMPALLRDLNLFDKNTELFFKRVETKIASGAGVLSPEAIRTLGEDLMREVFAAKRKVLEGERALLSDTPGLVIAAQAEDLWNEFALQTTKGLKPALKVVSDFMTEVSGALREWEGFAGTTQEVIGSIEKLFKGEITPGSLKGLTIGGLLMFMWTKNPIWLGVAAGTGIASGLGTLGEFFFDKDRAAQEDFNMILEGRGGPQGPTELRSRGGTEVTRVIEDFKDFLESWRREIFGSPDDQRTGRLSESPGDLRAGGIGMNWRGDLHINVNPVPGMNQEELVGAIWNKWQDSINRMTNDQAPGLEASNLVG
jgi:hypothetical protein